MSKGLDLEVIEAKRLERAFAAEELRARKVNRIAGQISKYTMRRIQKGDTEIPAKRSRLQLHGALFSRLGISERLKAKVELNAEAIESVIEDLNDLGLPAHSREKEIYGDDNGGITKSIFEIVIVPSDAPAPDVPAR